MRRRAELKEKDYIIKEVKWKVAKRGECSVRKGNGGNKLREKTPNTGEKKRKRELPFAFLGVSKINEISDDIFISFFFVF